MIFPESIIDMEKQEVIVDTCFLKKIASDGKYPENIHKILDELEFTPVTPRYVADQEFALNYFLDRLVKEGYIRIIENNEFLKDDIDKMIYEDHFYAIYAEMREYLKIKGGYKQMPELLMPRGKTIFSHHISGSSMGDVHMILTASFMRLPIILTEDSDIEILRDISKRRLSLDSYQLQIYDAIEVIEMIAKKIDSKITHKGLESLVKQIGEKRKWPEINVRWHEVHG